MYIFSAFLNSCFWIRQEERRNWGIEPDINQLNRTVVYSVIVGATWLCPIPILLTSSILTISWNHSGFHLKATIPRFRFQLNKIMGWLSSSHYIPPHLQSCCYKDKVRKLRVCRFPKKNWLQRKHINIFLSSISSRHNLSWSMSLGFPAYIVGSSLWEFMLDYCTRNKLEEKSLWPRLHTCKEI